MKTNDHHEHPDKEKFKNILLSARKTKSPEDFYNLGCCYHYGIGVYPNERKAAIYYRKSIDDGFSMGENNLGLLYLIGSDIKQDVLKGMALLKRAAEKGDTNAMSTLANVFLHARKYDEIPYDPVSGMKWLQQAAEAANPVAMNNLGIFYSIGDHGLQKDLTKAFNWLCKAHNAGNDISLKALLTIIETEPDIGPLGNHDVFFIRLTE